MSPVHIWCLSIFCFVAGFVWSKLDEDGKLPIGLFVLTLVALAAKGLNAW